MATDSLERLRESLNTGDVSCILVDEALTDASALATVQELSRSHPLIPVILLARSRSAEILTAAMDAGARTVLTLPLSLEELTNRLQPVLTWSQAARNEVTARNKLNNPSPRHRDSHCRGQRRRRYIDLGTHGCSPTGPARPHLPGGPRRARRRPRRHDGPVRATSITDLVDIAAEASSREISEVVYPLPGGLSLLPAPDHGEIGEAMTEAATRQVISMLRYQFDHVVLDCGSRLDDIMAMALDSSDRVFITTTPDTPAIRAVRRLTEALNRLDIARGRSTDLIVNRSGRQREIQPKTAARMAALPLAVSIP